MRIRWLTDLHRHFLFAAALVVLSSEFASLHRNPEYRETVRHALTIMTYCKQSDPQAARLCYILETFNEVAVRRRASDPESVPVPNTPTGSMSNSSSSDPMASFFLGATPLSNMQHNLPSLAGAFTPSAGLQQASPLNQLPPLQMTGHQDMASQSLGMMQPTAVTPASTSGDLINDADWLHFDMWDDWGSSSGAAAGPSSFGDPFTDAALYNPGNVSSSFGGAGCAGFGGS